jgi:hypothetical protein
MNNKKIKIKKNRCKKGTLILHLFFPKAGDETPIWKISFLYNRRKITLLSSGMGFSCAHERKKHSTVLKCGDL